MPPESDIATTGIGKGDLPDPTRVLLVDDDPAVRGSLKFAFELEGFEVEDYASAELVGEQHANCLVLDYRLPGMNGLQLLDLLRRRGSTAPAIIITSHPNRKIREQIAAAHATLIEKPLLCDALTGTIRALAEKRGLSA
jgi:FixJ family two-component response regulator